MTKRIATTFTFARRARRVDAEKMVREAMTNIAQREGTDLMRAYVMYPTSTQAVVVCEIDIDAELPPGFGRVH